MKRHLKISNSSYHSPNPNLNFIVCSRRQEQGTMESNEQMI